MDPRPVGLFDSGSGGLSVLGYLCALAPDERYLYFADTQYFPYGSRPAAEVRKRAFSVVHRLLQSEVKLVVIACNTASAAAAGDLRAAFEIPFVAMVPAVKPAASLSRTGRVAVLATTGTLDGAMYDEVRAEFGGGVALEAVPCPELAALIEAGELGSEAVRAQVHDALGPPVRNGVDTVVLGCTHFHFLEGLVKEEYPGINVIGTAEPVARRVVQVLSEGNLCAPAGSEGGLSFIVSGDRRRFVTLVKTLPWNRPAVGG
ncbi:MAG: glutamate racemase [Dehalococcoidia bacterium]